LPKSGKHTARDWKSHALATPHFIFIHGSMVPASVVSTNTADGSLRCPRILAIPWSQVGRVHAQMVLVKQANIPSPPVFASN
jgi:hypothetical protein